MKTIFNFKTAAAFISLIITISFISFCGSFNSAAAQQNTFIDPDAYSVITSAQNISLPAPFSFPKSTFVFPGDNILADTMTLNANPGPSNNGGSPAWAMLLNLVAHNNNVIVTQMSTANTGGANATFSVEIFTRVGNALGGPVGSGPGSSTAGWTSLGSVPAVQGSTANGISLIFNIPPIMVQAHDTVGVAIQFSIVGPRYYGTGSPPLENYSDTNLTLITGDARSAPFTPTGSWFSSRALCGVIRYVVESTLPNGWVEQTSGTVNGLNTVSTVSDQVGWIGGNGGVVLRTTNAGTNWTNVTGTPIGTDAVYAICGIDANTCLVSTSPAATFVFKTTNGGANWTQVFTQASPGFIDDIKMFSATNGFMYGDPVGARWTLFKTTNAGTNWDSTGLYLPQAGSEAGWNNAMCLKGTNLWFGTNNTRVYYSTNSGVNWLYGATTGTVNQYSVAFNGGGGIGFAGQTVAVKSTNGGANWAAFTVPGTGTIYGFSNILNEFWYGASTSIIYYSSDNGATFASQYSNPVTTALYQSLSFALTGNTIRGWAVTASGLISRYNETVTGITHNENEVPSSYSLSQNYPNPFNPSTKITYQLPKSENVRVTVFDLLGREVAVLVNEFKTAGTYNIEFNASQLSSGVYLYRIDAGEFKDVKKMVLVK
jgi:photosystem II stability/assembly factor-like uncharacterized protein